MTLKASTATGTVYRL